MHQNLSKLGLLEMLPDNSFYSRRYTDFVPPVFAAMVYDFFNRNNTRFYQVVEIADAPGSPASVFKLDAESFRQQIEDLHERGWLRYETTHNLDQIRLKPDFCALEFLKATWSGQVSAGEQFANRVETWSQRPSLLFVLQHDRNMAARKFRRFPQYTFIVDQSTGA